MGGISVDIVPVITDEDDESLYYIANLDKGDWIVSDPKGHKEWSTDTNKNNNNEYKPLVKIFKWWRRENCPGSKKYPKGITFEKIVADNLGDSSLSTEDFFIATMQNIISAYKEEYVDKESTPVISDPSKKVGDNDLLSGYTVDDFSSFIDKLEEHAELLNSEGTKNSTWRKVLGSEFPSDPNVLNSYALANFQKCAAAPHRQHLMWPVQRGGAAFISARVTALSGEVVEYQNNGEPLPKNCSLRFKAFTGVRPPYRVMWQIVNTGFEAQNSGCLRGDFEPSDEGVDVKTEATAYSGSHSVQCFIIKRGICVATSQEFIINIA